MNRQNTGISFQNWVHRIGLTLIATSLVLVLASCSGKTAQEVKGEEMNDFITRMAMKSEGDASRLSPEERKKMDDLTKGETEVVLRNHPSASMAAWKRQQGQTPGK